MELKQTTKALKEAEEEKKRLEVESAQVRLGLLPPTHPSTASVSGSPSLSISLSLSSFFSLSLFISHLPLLFFCPNSGSGEMLPVSDIIDCKAGS